MIGFPFLSQRNYESVGYGVAMHKFPHLGEVPFDSLPKSTSELVFQKLEKRDGITAVNLHLVEEGEPDLKRCFDELEDGRKIFGLLTAKLFTDQKANNSTA